MTGSLGRSPLSFIFASLHWPAWQTPTEVIMMKSKMSKNKMNMFSHAVAHALFKPLFDVTNTGHLSNCHEVKVPWLLFTHHVIENGGFVDPPLPAPLCHDHENFSWGPKEKGLRVVLLEDDDSNGDDAVQGVPRTLASSAWGLGRPAKGQLFLSTSSPCHRLHRRHRSHHKRLI